MRLTILPLLALLIMIPSLSLLAQRDTVRPAPGQVELRRIWMIKGGPGTRIGDGAGPVGDINHDGIGDFAVSSFIPWQWSVYLGDTAGPSTTPVWAFDSCAYLKRPVVGDFWGTGHKAVGFLREESRDYSYAFLHLFRTESGTLPDTPALIWQSVRPDTPLVKPYVDDYMAADLDGDGDDELIMVSPVVRHGTVNSYIGEVWIYKGGPDFQVDTPSVIVHGVKSDGGEFQLYVANLDGDDYPDLITRSYSSFLDSRLEFYYGRADFFTSMQRPDREFVVVNPMVTDIDGDDIADIITQQFDIYRSSAGKDMRTRSYDSSDVDLTIFSGRRDLRMFDLGYLSSKHYRMFAVELGGALTGFAGSPDGLDGDAEAFTGGGRDVASSPFGEVLPVGDVNGDGWDDIICSELGYPDQGLDYGIAMVFAGGPYIPNDDPVVSAQPMASVSSGSRLKIWPNPASATLTLDWSNIGSASTIEVSNMLGEVVHTYSLEARVSHGSWNCEQLAAGMYFITVYDRSGRRLLTERLLKQ